MRGRSPWPPNDSTNATRSRIDGRPAATTDSPPPKLIPMSPTRPFRARFRCSESHRAASEFEKRFQRRELPSDIEEVRWKASADSVWICRLLAETGLAKSNGEARRLVAQGAVKIDGERVSDPTHELALGTGVLVEVGKRRIVRVVPDG